MSNNIITNIYTVIYKTIHLYQTTNDKTKKKNSKDNRYTRGGHKLLEIFYLKTDHVEREVQKYEHHKNKNTRGYQ